MAIRPLVYLPDARLREPSKLIERVDDEVRRLAADMFETMEDAEGLGLAAVQVGVHRRLVVLDVPAPGDPETQKGEPRASRALILINPKILTLGDDRHTHEEGCLSIPEFRVDIERPGSLRLAYTDEHGKPQEMEASGLLATAIQHELDHLDGKLIVDFLSKLRRDIVIRRYRKMAKNGELE